MSSNLKIEVGKYYRAKKPIKVSDGGFNDRRVLWMSRDGSKVQYDGPAVDFNHHYPIVSIEKFLKWAGKEITQAEYELEV